jgi:hypothetical protein
MHFKNGRPAHNGDPVITKDYNGKIIVGVIFNLRDAGTCNVDIAYLIPGGTQHLTCQDVGQMYHAEDALIEMEAAWVAALTPPVAPPPAPSAPWLPNTAPVGLLPSDGINGPAVASAQ